MDKVYCPEWWRTTLEDVEECLKLVKKGKVQKIAESAGKRPIYRVDYGVSNVKLGRANASSAFGAKDINHYADKRGEDYNPTVFLCGCIHGGEFEGTMACLNLIKEIETGTDYKGESHPELMELVKKVHLIIVPISNPDGRSHVPYRSVLGMTYKTFRYYDQGTWLDGSLCEWPNCKAIHPIKDAVEYLGGYFNDDGVNMMHEDFFGKISNETQAVFDICRYDAPDFSILLHGGTNTTNCMLVCDFANKESVENILTISQSFADASTAAGVRSICAKPAANPHSFNLTSAMHHICGGDTVTFESNQGLVDAPGIICTPEEIYNAHLILFAETCRGVLKRFNKI